MIEPRSDDLARALAIDPARSILLQAPAGSGKTTVLTQRLLRLLAEVDEPEHILAITFTRKAAAEMRARVIRALRGQIEGEGEQADRLRALAAAVLARSATRGWDLLDHSGRLRIQTIDSFNFWLASQLPLAAKAGGALVVADRPEEAYLRAARNTLIAGEEDPALAADIELLFDRLDNGWRRVERLLADMLQKRGHWLRYVLGHDGGALRTRIVESLTDIVRDHLRTACGRIEPGLRALAQCVADIDLLGEEIPHLAAWQRLARTALTLKGEWRKPKGINKSMGPAYEQAAAKEALRNCIEHWSQMDGTLDTLRELAALPEPVLDEADAAALEALSRVLRLAAVQLQTEFTLDGRVDHTYIAGAARQALTENGEPTDLALRAGLALRHILVDEFQDTSLGQFYLLEALTVGWEPGDGRSLFVVGDPMQSIYQFREAEVGLFLRARDHGIGGVRLEALQLTRNFRSAPALIEWSNAAFGRLFPAKDDLRASAVAFTASVAARAEQLQAAVELKLFDSADRDAEAQAIAQRIAELRQQRPAATMAVLVASRSHAIPIITALQASAIDAIGVDLIPLGDLSIVRDLVALTRALHHFGDRTSWLTVLRAPWSGVTLASLTELSHREDAALVWESMHDGIRLQRCEASDRVRIARIRAVLEMAFAARDRGPLAEWLETTWLRLGAADAYSVEDLPHARAFFTAIDERVASGEWRGAQDIDALISDLYAQPQTTAPNPVEIMTIHRAKGLEFDHVFVPSLDRELNRGTEPLLRWLDLPREEGSSDLLMAPVPAIGDEEGGRLGAYLKRLTAARAANERARLLYVAATRAKHTLHFTAAPKPRADGAIVPRSGTLLACLWPALGAEFKQAENIADAMPVTAPPTQTLRRLPAQWVSPELPPAMELSRLPIEQASLAQVEFSWAGEALRHIGTAVHAVFEQFAQQSALPSRAQIEESRVLIRQKLHRLGVLDAELNDATATVLDALTRTVEDERGRWIFAATHRDARSEYALTGIAAGRLTNAIIDRSFVDSAGFRWVIDFKTSRHEGGDVEAFLNREIERYRPQLETYAALAGALGPEPVRAGLYFPLLGAFREL